MANINHAPSKYMLNLLHVLPAFADEENNIINSIIEVKAWTINKYEIITESWALKLDRVWYSSITYPFTYWAIPCTWDLDNDPLDVEIVWVTEEILPWAVVELRILWVMKFIDGGEVDDKVIAVVNDDKRNSHIKTIEDLGEQFIKETTYYWEHYKDLKKPGTGKVEGFFGVEEAVNIIKECEERYVKEYLPKFN